MQSPAGGIAMFTNRSIEKVTLRTIGILLPMATFCFQSHASDAVVEWNSIASQAVATATAAGRPGPAAGLDFATVHLAIHDAVQAIEKQYQPYETRISGATGSSSAAAAKAARDV